MVTATSSRVSKLKRKHKLTGITRDMNQKNRVYVGAGGLVLIIYVAEDEENA